jgi:hypothetical protein
MARPACTPAAIRAVLAANADADVVRRYDDDLDTAFEQARERNDVTPLVETVRRWWFEADAWRDPDAQREFLAGSSATSVNGPRPLRNALAGRKSGRSTVSGARAAGTSTTLRGSTSPA